MLKRKIQKGYEKNTYYPWVIVSLAILTVFFSGPGQTYFISGFTESFIDTFGLTRTQISLYYSGATLSAGLLLMVVGKFIDKWGHRRMTMLIGGALGGVCFFMGNIPAAMLLVFGFFLLRLLGQGSMVLLPSTLIPNWFIKKRAFALSLVTLGGVLGSVAIPPINTWLLTMVSWRVVWMIWGGLLWAIFVPLIYLFLYNEPAKGQSSHSEVALAKAEAKEGWRLDEVVKTGCFWRMVYSQSIPALVNTGLFFHMTSIMEEKGQSPAVAAMILSLIGLCSFPSTFLAGFVLERVKVHYVYFLSFLLQAVGTIILMMAGGKGLAIVFAVIFGMITGFQNVCRRLIWPEYYGRKHLSTISGLTMTALVIGSAVGPLIIGAGYDIYGSYKSVMIVMMGLCLIAALCSILSPAPKKREH